MIYENACNIYTHTNIYPYISIQHYTQRKGLFYTVVNAYFYINIKKRTHDAITEKNLFFSSHIYCPVERFSLLLDKVFICLNLTFNNIPLLLFTWACVKVN